MLVALLLQQDASLLQSLYDCLIPLLLHLQAQNEEFLQKWGSSFLGV